nr:potassium channel family protein [Mongoliitalea daihaiensis]
MLSYFDYFICLIFLSEFFYNLLTAENKLKYLKWGWIDLISSIPMLDSLRYGRVFRLIRLIRVIKAYNTFNSFLKNLFPDTAKGSVFSVIILGFFVLIFSSIAILVLENDVESNITNAEDAIWWSYTTITTVGYGDKYPVTTLGRILAMFLMTYGISVFGVITAYIASIFVKSSE